MSIGWQNRFEIIEDRKDAVCILTKFCISRTFPYKLISKYCLKFRKKNNCTPCAIAIFSNAAVFPLKNDT